MGLAVAAIGWALLALATLGALYTLASALALGWFAGRPQPTAEVYPAVTILKPLHGDEPGLHAALGGFCRQDYPGPIQIVFGVREAFDPAVAVVRALMREHPDLDARLVIDPRVWGTNLKISNLINMETAIAHPVVVLADSDVSVRPDYVRRLVAALADPKVGYATCAFIGVATGNLWSRVSAMDINHHFLPSIALALRLKLAKPCFGPTVAFSRRTLDRIGGFGRFADRLADDFEIGRAIRELGYSFAVPTMLIGHGCPEVSGRGVVSHELRWARTIKLIDPVGYLCSGVCHPLPFALGGLLALQAPPAAWAVLGLVIAARLGVVVQVARLAGADAGVWWLSCLRDLLSASIYLWSFTVRTVEWRGRRFTVERDGALAPAPTCTTSEALHAFKPALQPAILSPDPVPLRPLSSAA